MSRPVPEKKDDYRLQIPTENGRYRADDDKGSYLVDVYDGVVTHPGYVRPKGTVEPAWKLAVDHTVFVKLEKPSAVTN